MIIKFIAKQVVATSYESFESLQEVYVDAIDNISELSELGVECFHGIDATSKNSNVHLCFIL